MGHTMSNNPYLDRCDHANKQSNAYWRAPKQEKKIASTLKGTNISGSGSGRKKGDVCVKGISRIECKTTQNKSFSITRDMVDKITNAGICSGELPAITVEFIDSKGAPTSGVAVIPMWALEMLILKAKNNGNT
jgi:hypothetical protein